jgi:hypothetical protein
MTYVYVVRYCEPCEGCSDKLITLDPVQAHTLYVKLRKKEAEEHMASVKKFDEENNTNHGAFNYILGCEYEITQALLGKEYDHDIREEG